MLKDNLEAKYSERGFFCFDFSNPYREVCNAPKDRSGVYLIYKIFEKTETLIYIGSSGQRKDGRLKTRKGGMFDRLVNGYHPNRFGQTKRIKRHVALPAKMQNDLITEIKIYWFVTHDETYVDFPTDVEKKLTEQYLVEFKTMPEWHQQATILEI